MTPRRNIHAERLLEFPDLVLGEQRVFSQRGRWREVFADRIGTAFDNRIVFEIGCADATSLCAIAEKFPETAFVGIDWKFKSLHIAAERAKSLNLRNVMLLRGRAQDIARIFADGELDEVWLFHPDPCDRPIELKNRLINEKFLIDLHGVLRGPGASLCLKTDHPGYYQWTLGLLGLPQPMWFNLQQTEPGKSSPRVKRREVVPIADVPARSDAILSRFEVATNSTDFWNDAAAQSATASKLFTGSVTPFEQRFIKKRLPIYYVELSAKRINA